MNENDDKSRVTHHAAQAALYVLLALLAAAPLWGPGMVNTRGGGDSPFLLQRTLDMAENLRRGIFPPRWMPHAAYDLGYPLFNYYAALPYDLSGGLTAVGISPIVAIQATQTFGLILAALAMALWARRIYKSRAAVLLATATYTFAPFHLVNLYVRGDSLSEFYAFVWYPLILWALDRMAERPTAGRTATAALAYGALILTHNASALIFSPFALLYQVTRCKSQIASDKSQIIRRWAIWSVRIVAPFVVGFLLTAWFWLPALGETGYGQMGPEFTAGYFHYSNHFRGLNLVQPSFLFDYSVAPRAQDAGPFAMGAVQAGLAIAGAAALFVQSLTQRAPTSRGYLLFGLFLSTFMITPLSRPLWDHLPLLEVTQFPWRFLSVQALFTAIITGALGEILHRKRTPADELKPEVQNATPGRLLRFTFYVLLCGLPVLAACLNLHPDRLLIGDNDVTWENLRLYEAFTGNIGTTIRYEYLPQDVVPRLYISEAVIDGQGRPIADGGELSGAALLERTPIKQVWQVKLESGDAPVAFPLNCWPGWEAQVDGTQVAAYPMTGSGRLTVDLTGGEHTVTLRLRNTPLRTAAVLVSGVTLLAGTALLILKTPRPRIRKSTGLRTLGIAGALLLSAGLPALFHRAPNAPATFFDFDQMPYPHAGPVDFGAARLKSAELSATTVKSGDALVAALSWDLLTAEPLTATLRLVSPAEPRHAISYLLTSSLSHALTPSAPFTLTLPTDLARGLYLVQLRLYGPEGEIHARTAHGQGMGTLYVGAVRAPHGPARRLDLPVLATFDDLTLHAVEPEQPDPTTLRLKMTWSTPGTPRNWSLSLRLLDADGQQLVQRDLQPGYGYLPTTLWLPGEPVADAPVLPLPGGLAPGDYTLRVITYLQATMQGGGEIDIPIRLTTPTLYDLRESCCEQTRKGATILCEAGGLALLGLDLPETIVEGNALDFHAEWNAISAPTGDFTARWELLAPDGSAVGVKEGPLAPGSHTSGWPRRTWVRAQVHVDLPALLPQGPYNLRLTLFDGETEATCALPPTLAVTPRSRVFTAPAISHPQTADFGDEIRLLGYDLSQQPTTLTLTLWWQAKITPTRDYKRFVHLYDPATEQIPAQDDAMPRDWTYPTSWWIAGEIVSETVTLDLRAAPQGAYRLGVGWYAPETSNRLPASDAAGEPQPADRVTLETPIVRPK